MWFIGVEVEQETSAPPPKRNPGSAPTGEWGGGSNAKERDSPSFRSPEAGISEFGKRLLHYVTLLLQPSSHVLKLIK